MVLSTIRKYLELIKFSHTIFALPFAFISFLSVLKNPGIVLSKSIPELLLWITLAMIGARSGAMGFNRLIDRKWDKQNPRTHNRPSASGDITPMQMKLMIVVSFALLIFSAWNLNFLSFLLSPLAVAALCFYSYTKRFTALAHVFLGAVIGMTPSAVWIATTGELTIIPVILSVSMLCWIAGFDILYSLQDMEFDRQNRLFSIPSRYGVNSSLWISRFFHILTFVLWGAFSFLANYGPIFNTGIGICGFLLLVEHRFIHPHDLQNVNIAFFNINSIISIVLLTFLIIDLYLKDFFTLYIN